MKWLRIYKHRERSASTSPINHYESVRKHRWHRKVLWRDVAPCGVAHPALGHVVLDTFWRGEVHSLERWSMRSIAFNRRL